MYPISSSVKALFDAEQKQILRITGTDKNGVTISITDANVVMGGFSVDRYCCNGEKLEVGTAIAGELNLTLNNSHGQFDSIVFEGAELFVEVGIADWSQQSPSVTYIPIGYFTPDVQPRRQTIINVKALDRMTKFDAAVDVTALTLPDTVAGLAGQVCTVCGVTLAASISSLPNATVSITELPDVSGVMTYRNLIQWCAGIMATNAWMDWDGNLRFTWYDNTTDYESTPANRFSSDYYENDLEITGAMYTNNAGVEMVSGTDDYAIDLTGNGLIGPVLATALPAINTAVNGFTYRPFSATVINAPYLWPMDVVDFEDKDGNTYTSVLTNVCFGLNSTTVLESKGLTYALNAQQKPSGFTKEQAQIINEVSNKIETDIDESLTQQDIFNRLTDNGAAQGMVLYNGQLYVNATYINAGEMSADRISGGTLTLGGANNANGVMQVLDASGNVIDEINNLGVVTYASDVLSRALMKSGAFALQVYAFHTGTGQMMWQDQASISASGNDTTVNSIRGKLKLYGYGIINLQNRQGAGDAEYGEIDLTDNVLTVKLSDSHGVDGPLTITASQSGGITVSQNVYTEQGTQTLAATYSHLGSLSIPGNMTAKKYSGDYWSIANGTIEIGTLPDIGDGEEVPVDDAPETIDVLQIGANGTTPIVARQHNSGSPRIVLLLDSDGNTTFPGTVSAGSFSGVKVIQTAVSDPTASGTSVTFIDSISQNTQGVIVPTKKTVRSASQSASGLMSSTDKTKLDGIASGAQVNSITGVKGDAESTYRTGDVNLTPANIGAFPSSGGDVTGDITIKKSSAPRVNIHDTNRTVLWYGMSSNGLYHGIYSNGYYDSDGVWHSDAHYLIRRTTSGNADIFMPLTVNGDITASNGKLVATNTTTTANDGYAALRMEVTDSTLSTTQVTDIIKGYHAHSSTGANGFNLVVYPGGNLFIGGGESAQNLYNTIGVGSTYERTYITADSEIYLEANCDTIANRKGFKINTNGNIIPVAAETNTDNVQNIGSASTRWANVYAKTFVGDLDGVPSRRMTFEKGTNPSSQQGRDLIRIYDASGTGSEDMIGYAGVTVAANGNNRFYIRAYKNEAGSTANNYLAVVANADGTNAYEVADPAAFRTAIQAPTDILLTSTDDTVAEVYAKLTAIPTYHSAPIYMSATPAKVLSNNKIAFAIKGIVCRINASAYDFIVTGLASGSDLSNLYTWRVTSLTDSAITVAAVYKHTGTAM